MSKQGRGSAVQKKTSILAALLLWMVVGLEYAEAASFIVGDTSGWGFKSQNWPQGKRFRADDVLIFNYDSTIHNVVAVDKAGYVNCKAPANANVYATGKDQVKLPRGQSYFICNLPGHCDSGMKIAVNAV
ncbi:basic blue protein-like [Ziziphus jujuba]|uniref:Basic blue protein-like n=1 Tax=Ziziphus jujuba TaxID=326968 RepID=A0ABM4AAF8_ZIZJJ|nr:basic blue protein-like [Ziziphus jujuba]